MTAITAQKAFLYETSGSAKGLRERRNLDYKLEGHHATLASRESSSNKGKYSLSVGRKIDLSKETETKQEIKKNEQADIEPVILPKCREDTFNSLMEDEVQKSTECESPYLLLRENTDDVPLTKELLHNELSEKPPAVLCAHCAKIGRYTKYKHSIIHNGDPDSQPCVICEKRKNLRRKNVKEEKMLLMSIVYPHDFYDRYQSARRRVQTPSDDGEKRKEKNKKSTYQKLVLPKTNVTLPETINEGAKVILKPHVVKLKNDKKVEKEKKYQNTEQIEHEPNSMSPVPQFPPLSQSPTRPKHLRCQPQMKAYFVASMPSYSVLKNKYSYFDQKRPFRGCLLSKSDKYEKYKTADMKHSFINVGTLGLTIGIPEYNDKLGNRQTTTNSYLSRTFTSLTNLKRPQSMLPPVKNKVRPPGSIGHRSM